MDKKVVSGVIGTIDINNGLIVNGKSEIDNPADDSRYQEELEGTVKLAFKGTTNFSFNLPFALNICPQGESAGKLNAQIVNIGYT
jgi:hypothetical protein